tara:strand:+ start:564 stop:761 length:198 start_codon:yes stop_codon:yes gene_type:complete
MQEPKKQIISGVPEDQMYLDKEVPKIDNIIKKAVVEELVKVNQLDEVEEEDQEAMEDQEIDPELL